MCVLRCLVKLADLGNVLQQYLHPYLSLLGLPTPPLAVPPSIAFKVFCTGTWSRLESEPVTPKGAGDAVGNAGVLEYRDDEDS